MMFYMKELARKRFSWLLDISYLKEPVISSCPCKVYSRPTLNINEETMEGHWDQLKTSFKSFNELTVFYEYLRKVYDFSEKNPRPPERFDGTNVTLRMYQAEPLQALEEWVLEDAIPAQISFGELDFTSSEECEIEVLWKFEKCHYRCLTSPSPA